jgi:allophanate hydrolase
MIPLSSLHALQAGLTDGRWTPVDVVEAVIARRDSGQAAAWIDHVPADDLRAAARRLADEGPSGRPLWGVPFAVKGNIDVAGLPTTAGCASYAAGPATGHATVVARLVAAGALPVGTTNLDQFATGLVGTRTPYGACHAVGHPGWISGGSSSGSAVVVAAGVVPFALGTDTAGSGRVPAALNGLGSFKPTRGRISAAGIVPACRSLDCVAVFAATPAEAARVADIAAGPDPADPWSRVAPATAPLTSADGRAASIGVPTVDSLDYSGDEVAARAHGAAVERARACGWTLVDVDVGPFLAAAELLYGGAFVAERYAAVGGFVASGAPGLDPVVAGIVGGAADLPAWQAFADLDRLQALRAAAARVWAEVDALLLPVAPTTFTHAQVADDPVGTNATLGRFTNFANLLDLCAAVAPVAPRDDGHPWGVQLVGPAWTDATVAALAQELTTGPDAGEAESPCAAGAAAPAAGTVPPREQTLDEVALVVAGAHLRGEALEHQVVERGGRWLRTTRTAAVYALHLVTDDPPRPGLVRTSGTGSAIEVDVWALPPEGWARFVAAGVPGLAVGRVELAGGAVLPGFVAAADEAGGRPDLTPFGGWRAWRAAGSPR